MKRIDGRSPARITKVSRAAIAASRKYPEKNVWYFRKGNNECFVIGGLSMDAFYQSGIARTPLGVERRLYVGGRKVM